MTTIIDLAKQKALLAAFKMPSMQKIISRKTSITNAFVSAVIPVLKPSFAEIDEALTVLAMDPLDVRCIYCGDKASEWDHLRPLVIDRRPTGYISEIANLVPSCGKCNQSKGNKAWRDWMVSGAKLSPTGRGIAAIASRIERLDAYERWRNPTRVDFESILGSEAWEHYWLQCEGVIKEFHRCQDIANAIRKIIITNLGGNHK